MQIYAPCEYPDPIFFKSVNVGTDNVVFITVRFHTLAEGMDYLMDVDPDIHGNLADAPNGNLLIDLWSDDWGDDWIASTVFKVTPNALELAESRAFGRWRNMGLINLMAIRALDITAKQRTLVGMERSMDEQF